MADDNYVSGLSYLMFEGEQIPLKKAVGLANLVGDWNSVQSDQTNIYSGTVPNSNIEVRVSQHSSDDGTTYSVAISNNGKPVFQGSYGANTSIKDIPVENSIAVDLYQGIEKSFQEEKQRALDQEARMNDPEALIEAAKPGVTYVWKQAEEKLAGMVNKFMENHLPWGRYLNRQ